jgi:hypothetical protein
VKRETRNAKCNRKDAEDAKVRKGFMVLGIKNYVEKEIPIYTYGIYSGSHSPLRTNKQ